MTACEKRVSGSIMSYPCTLGAGHERNGPAEDPEPCMTPEVERSVRLHTYWEAREAYRTQGVPETVDDVVNDAMEAMAAHDVAEPEHNLRAGECMMRPADSAPPVIGEVCPMCSTGQRPLVLVANDEMIKAGEIHNPYDEHCDRRLDERVLPDEVCVLCAKSAQSPGVKPEEEIDRNARAYGFEVGKGHPLTEVIEQTSPDNPFMNPDWRQSVEAKEFGQAAVPTKQRPGDQVLPKKGDRPVQDWMIERERERYLSGFKTQILPEAESGATVIRAMDESKRVGIERYGQPLHTFDGRLNIRDLAEELRDAFVYISKMQMVAEADRETLVRMVEQRLDFEFHANGIDSRAALIPTQEMAELAVDTILDWVLIQRIGPEQVMPIRPSGADEEWMGT